MTTRSEVAQELHDALRDADAAMARVEHAIIDAASVPNRKNVELSLYALSIERIKDYQGRLKVALEQASKALSMRVSNGATVDSEDGKQLERKDGANRKTWQHDQLRAIVAEKVIERHLRKDGSLDAPVSVLIVEALKFPSISSWKVTELRSVGVNPDSYCKKKDGTVNFTVVDLNSEKANEGTDDDDFL